MIQSILSTTWPFNRGLMTVDDVVLHLELLHADTVCIRAPVYFTQLQSANLPVAQAFHDELVGKLPEGVGVALWPVVSLYNPELMADRIAEYAEHYNPDLIILDAERHWVTDYIANLPRFLNRLAAHMVSGRVRCPVGLGSYRRANLHANMNWQTWLTHKRPDGAYTIGFAGHQLYPLGWITPSQWVAQMSLDVDSHEAEHRRAGRPEIEWMPWMPSFIGGTYEGLPTSWVPSAPAYGAALKYLTDRLGSRLMGFNHWSLDVDLVDPRMVPIYDLVRSLGVEPGPIEPTLEEKVAILWREGLAHGWNLTP